MKENNLKIKNPKNLRFENFNKNPWKMWINWKRRAKKVLPALEDKDTWEKLGRKRQNRLRLDRLSKNSQKAFEKIWIEWRTRERKIFLKTHSTNFDWSKIRFDRSKINFDRSNINQARQIQTLIFIAFFISRATSSIDQKYGKNKFLKNRAF